MGASLFLAQRDAGDRRMKEGPSGGHACQTVLCRRALAVLCRGQFPLTQNGVKDSYAPVRIAARRLMDECRGGCMCEHLVQRLAARPDRDRETDSMTARACNNSFVRLAKLSGENPGPCAVGLSHRLQITVIWRRRKWESR